jgi:phospholipid/cholesterol/gamma-HCH transport system ATP-binding protein
MSGDCNAPTIRTGEKPHIEVRNLTMAFGDFVLQRDLSFSIPRGSIFVIMGGSGCGKSTLLRHILGLLQPAKGSILLDGEEITGLPDDQRERIMRRFGVLYQSGALWSSMTLAENVSLPLEEYTELEPAAIREIATLKLAMVGLRGFEDYYPSEISGGMQKRVGLARAIALDPEILCIDEPSAGLDPISSKRLDDLILELRDSMDTTVVIVTHELPSIYSIGTDSVFLDAETRTMIASGPPVWLRDHCDHPTVHTFMTRGEENG